MKMVTAAALTVAALLAPAAAGAQAPAPPQYRAVCDPLGWHEDLVLAPVVSQRPRNCGYWGPDGNGSMAVVVNVHRMRWNRWDRIAQGRGWAVPNHPGQGEKPTRVTVTLSEPYACVHGDRTVYLYTRERIRTRYGPYTFAMRDVPADYCAAADAGVNQDVP